MTEQPIRTEVRGAGRYRVIALPPDVVLLWFATPNTAFANVEPLPEDTQFVNGRWNPMSSQMELLIEHESFDLVPADQMVPYHTLKIVPMQLRKDARDYLAASRQSLDEREMAVYTPPKRHLREK